jgi:hypothetical protein
MLNRLSAFLFFLSFGIFANVQGSVPALTADSRASLLTCGPGDVLYEAFGHTAILIYDPNLGIERVYNYGTFDFNQPNFYLNFTRGNLLYQLAVGRFTNFVRAYSYYDRSVHEQVLNLTLQQRQRLFEMLEENALPANRDYLYDYFFDNCSTRPRDIIEAAVGGIISYDSSHVEMPRRSIRQLVDRCIKRDMPWGDLGIDICLGSRIDLPATAREYTFLPDELELAFDHASIFTDEGLQPLVRQKMVHYESEVRVKEKSWFAPQPVFVGILLFLAVIVTFLRVAGKRTSILEGTVFLLIGLLGWSLLLLWFGTNHTSAANNWNLLWAFPAHLFYGIALFKRERPKWVRLYTFGVIGLCLALLLGWGFLPQMLHYSLRFIVILQLFLAVGVLRAGFQPKPSA